MSDGVTMRQVDGSRCRRIKLLLRVGCTVLTIAAGVLTLLHAGAPVHGLHLDEEAQSYMHRYSCSTARRTQLDVCDADWWL